MLHARKHDEHAQQAAAAAADLERLDRAIVEQRAAQAARSDETDMNVRHDAAAAALEGILRSLESADAEAAQVRDLSALSARVSELGDRLATVDLATKEQLRHLGAKLAETEDLTTHLSEVRRRKRRRGRGAGGSRRRKRKRERRGNRRSISYVTICPSPRVRQSATPIT